MSSKNFEEKKKEAEMRYERLKQEREKAKKQKIDNLKNVINTLKTKPKFIKLLEYALNSLDLLLTPPNRDIKLNSQVTIEENGIESLKIVSSNNIDNEDIVKKVSIILSKLIGEPVDKELAALFIEKAGHDLIFEMIFSKNPSESSIYLVKIMNSLVQVPQLTQKLIDSGIIEAVKIVNDLYFDFPEIIELNLDTMKKLSNLKKGRDIFAKKNMLPSLLKTLEKLATEKNEKGVHQGMQIVDNITRSEEGTDLLKSSKMMDQITKILDHLDSNEEILQLGAKIYSKVSSKEDFENGLNKIICNDDEELTDITKLKEIEKTTLLISNLCLIDDNLQVLKEKEKLIAYKKLFQNLNAIDLTDKSKEYVNSFNTTLKHYMKIFTRIVNNLDSEELTDFADSEFISAAIKSLKTNYLKSSNNKQLGVESNNADISVFNADTQELQDLANSENGNLFCEQLVSTSNLLKKAVENSCRNNDTIDESYFTHLNDLMEINKVFQPSFQTNEKFNLAASKIINLSNQAKQDGNIKCMKLTEGDSALFNYYIDEFKLKFPNLFDFSSLQQYFKNVINISTNHETVENIIKTLISKFNKDFDIEKICDFLPTIIHSLTHKYENRPIVESLLKFLDMISSNPKFTSYLEKQSKLETSKLFNCDLITPISTALTKHKYSSITQIKSVCFISYDSSSLKKRASEALIEDKINILGGKILEKLINDIDIKRHLNQFKESTSNFKPDNYSIENITSLEQNFQIFLSLLESDKLFSAIFNQVLSEDRSFIKKELNFIEMFKNKQENTKKENYGEILSASSKRLYMAMGIIQKVNYKCQQFSAETENAEEKNSYINGVKTVIDINLELFDKSSDVQSLVKIIENTKNDVNFMIDNSSDLNVSAKSEKSLFDIFKDKKLDKVQFEDNIIEKIVNSTIKLIRKYIEEPIICEKAIELLNEVIEKNSESANTLVKSGFPKLLLQLIESGSKDSLIKSSLILLQKIGDSNPENLEILSNQDILNKLYDINANYGQGIAEYSGPILNSLMRLSGNEEKISDILESTIKEFNAESRDLENCEFFSSKAPQLQELISKINFFTCIGGRHINILLKDDVFKKSLKILVKMTNEDSDLSKFKEPLLIIESDILVKMYNAASNISSIFDNDLDSEKEEIVRIILTISQNQNFREPLLSSLTTIQDFIKDTSDPTTFEKLSESLNEEFINKLFEINENYLGDNEIQNSINNLLCSICFHSEERTQFIISKGGLNNVVNDLKYLIKSDSEDAQKKKNNNLKLIDTLIQDPKNMKKFVDIKGSELITSLLRHEVKRSDDILEKNKKILESSDNRNEIKRRNSTRKITNIQKNKMLNKQISSINTRDRITTVKSQDGIKESNNSIQISENKESILQNYLVLDDYYKDNLLGSDFEFGSHIPICLNIATQLLANGNKLGPQFSKWAINLGSRGFGSIENFKSIINILKGLINHDPSSFNENIPITTKRILSQLLISGLNEFSNKIITPNSSQKNKPITSELISLNEEQKENINIILAQISDEEEIGNIKLLCEKIALINVSEESKDYNNPETIQQFVIFMNKALETNLHQLKTKKDSYKTSLTAALLAIYNKARSYLISEDSVISFIKLINHIAEVEERNVKSIFDENLTKSLFSIANVHFVPENINAVDSIINVMEELFSHCSGSLILNPNYLDYLKNIYLRSFEIFDYYLSLVSPSTKKNYNAVSLQSELPRISKVIDNIKNYICTYWKIDRDIDYKISTLKRLVTTCLNFIRNEDITYNEKKPFWEILQAITKGDMSNSILENEDLTTSILDLLEKDIKLNSNEEMLTDYLYLLSNKVTSHDIVAERIFKLISNDISKYNDSIPSNILSKHLKCLASLVKVPIIPRLMAKNKLYMNQLSHFYSESSDGSAEDRLNIVKIFNPILDNDLNNEALVKDCPNLYKNLIKNLTKPIDLEDALNEQTNKNEIDCLVNLMKSEKIYNSLMSSEILDNNMLAEIFKLYENDEKMKECEFQLKDIKEQVDKDARIKRNKEEIETLSKSVNDLYRKNIDQVKEMQRQGLFSSNEFMRNSSIRVSKLSCSSANVPLFPAFDEDVSNTNYKSELSIKNNPDIISYIKVSISKINSLFNDIISEYSSDSESINTQEFKDKVFLIKDLFKALKKLALHPDNHKTIFELGLNDMLEKFSNESNEDLKYYLLNDALTCAKLGTTTTNGINSFIKSQAADIILDDLIEKYDKIDSLSANDSIRKMFIVSNGIFMNLCKTKEGFDFVFEKIGLSKLLEISKRTQNTDILGSIQQTILNFLKSGNSLGDLTQEVANFNLKCAKNSKKTPKMLTDALLIAGSLVGNSDIKISTSSSRSSVSLNMSQSVNDSIFNNDRNLLNSGVVRRKSVNYNPNIIQAQNALISQAYKDFDILTQNIENFNSLLYYLGKVSNESVSCNIEIEKSELINKISSQFDRNNINATENDEFKEILEESEEIRLVSATGEDNEMQAENKVLLTLPNSYKEDLYGNDAICENYTNLISNMLSYSSENIAKFCKMSIIDHILRILQKYEDDDNQQIILNCLVALNSVALNDEGVKFIAKASKLKFQDIMMEVIQEKEKDPEIIKYALKAISNYLYKDLSLNYKNLNLEAIVQLLIDIQKKNYANADILININALAHNLINNLPNKEKDAKEKLFRIINNSILMQASNTSIVIPGLRIVNDLVSKNSNLMEELAENSISNIIQVYDDLQTNASCCTLATKILSTCASNSIYSYTMLNFGLLQQIEKILNYYSDNDSSDKQILEKEIFELLGKIAIEVKSAEKISEILMKHIINFINNKESSNLEMLRKLLVSLTKHKKAIEPFIQYDGVNTIKQQLLIEDLSSTAILDLFKIINNIIDANQDYKQEMLNAGVPDIVKSLIPKYSLLDKKIEFEGRCKYKIFNIKIFINLYFITKIAIIFSINQALFKLEEIKSIDVVEVKMESALKQEVKNFVTNGKIIKM